MAVLVTAPEVAPGGSWILCDRKMLGRHGTGTRTRGQKQHKDHPFEAKVNQPTTYLVTLIFYPHKGMEGDSPEGVGYLRMLSHVIASHAPSSRFFTLWQKLLAGGAGVRAVLGFGRSG